MKESTFEVMQRKDLERLEKLRKNGKNVNDYTYDETISIKEAQEIAGIQSPELISDNNKTIIEAAREEMSQSQPNKNDSIEPKANTIDKGIIHTNTQPDKALEIGENDSGEER